MPFDLLQDRLENAGRVLEAHNLKQNHSASVLWENDMKDKKKKKKKKKKKHKEWGVLKKVCK